MKNEITKLLIEADGDIQTVKIKAKRFRSKKAHKALDKLNNVLSHWASLYEKELE